MPKLEHTINISRYYSDSSWVQEYNVEMNPTDRLLDALIYIKDTLDGTLTFRRSCAHGICGSCAVMVNGVNRLACQCLASQMPRVINVAPLPALPVIKDLVVGMEPFFDKNEAVIPYLLNDEPPPERERIQSQQEQQKTMEAATCIMCSCCTNACPSVWADRQYLGPAALLKAYRFIFDSRDTATDVRLKAIASEHGLWRCHSVYNCVEVCPKGIDITKHLNELKRLAISSRLKI